MGFRDRRLLGLLAGNFVVAINFYIVAGLLDVIAADLNVSVAKAGMLISAFAVTSVIGAPVLASLSSRLDRRTLLVGTLLLCAAANLVGCFARNFSQLLGVRIFAAVASAVFTPQAAATIGALVSQERRGSSLSIIMLGWSLAGIFGLPLGVLVGTQFGWRAAFALNMVGSVAVAVLLYRSLPPGLYAPTLNLARWFQVLRSPPLMLLIAASAMMSGANQTVFSYLAPLARQLLGLSGAALSALFIVHGVAAVTANMSAAVMLRRVDADRMALCWALCAAAALALWPACLLWLPLVFALQFLWSLGVAGFPTVQQARLAAAAPELVAASIALNSSAGYLGQAIGATLGGIVWISPGPRFLTWAALLLAVPGLCVSLLAHRARLRRSTAQAA